MGICVCVVAMYFWDAWKLCLFRNICLFCLDSIRSRCPRHFVSVACVLGAHLIGLNVVVYIIVIVVFGPKDSYELI